MTTVPGTCFTKEQLEDDLKFDYVSDGDRTGSDRMRQIGFMYGTNKKQYDKAVAWYLLAAMKNNSRAQCNIGVAYYNGLGVPQNYLCALKWYLKAVEQCEYENTPNYIGDLFENGHGVQLDKYKALEWYCHKRDKTPRDRLKYQGYHLSASDMEKPLEQLRKETEAILDAEKKKLEEEQDKTQQEMEKLVDLNITYKLTGGGKDAWKGVPILFIDDRQRYKKPVNNSATNKDQEILELKKQIQLLKQDGDTFESQAKQLPPLKQEKSNFQLQIKERDRQLTLLRNDFQLLHDKNVTFQQQINTNDIKITSLQRENQELRLKTNNLEQQSMSFQTENQSLKYGIEEYEQQINVKDNLLENEKREHRRTSIQQTQVLNSLKQEKQTMEQSIKDTYNEMERLKSSYTILEQLLKSKEDAIVSLNRENQLISTANQGNQQGANEMVDTLKSLLQAKNSEIELNNLKMENALDKEKGKIKKLLKEIKRLKQHQQASSSRETRPSSSATVPESTTSSNTTFPEPTTSNTGTNEDDPNNDFNYDTECGTEYSSSDDTSSEDGDHANDLNYSSSDGTSSEDGDHTNDLNYDSDV